MRPLLFLLFVAAVIFTTAYLHLFHPVGSDHDYAQEYS